MIPRIEKITKGILNELNICFAKDVKVKKIAKHLGIRLREDVLNNRTSGLLIYKNETAHIIYNKDEGLARKRFTIAHEIGHFKLHKSSFSLSESGQVLYRNGNSSTGENKAEREANAFAASLLMPEDFIDYEIENAPDKVDNAVSYLADKFRVSEQAMTFRLANLGYDISGI